MEGFSATRWNCIKQRRDVFSKVHITSFLNVHRTFISLAKHICVSLDYIYVQKTIIEGHE